MNRPYRFSWVLMATLCVAPSAFGAPQAQKEKPLAPISPSEWNERTAAHLLDRAGFGGTLEEIKELASLSPKQAVERLINFNRVTQRERLNEFVIQPYIPPPPKPDQNKYERNLQVFFGRVAQDNQQIEAARDWWLERMLLSTRPLQEKLTLFWHGHLTSSNAGVYMSGNMIRQNQLFRRHAAGNVGELMLAISKDPAMLRYLNNNANVKGRPNENYARELMELFTLGEGNYTESDIKEAARAFTGWTYTYDGVFIKRPNLHDHGEKTFLGKTGNFDGDDIVEIIMSRPEHARFICEELFKFFVNDNPSTKQINAMVWTYRVGGNRVGPVLQKLFLSKDFYSQQAMGTRVKSPVEYLVSTWKSLGLKKVPQRHRLKTDLAEMGQVLLYPPTVEGWEGGRAWITSSTLLSRYNVAGRLILGAEVDPSRPSLVLPPAMAWVPVKQTEAAKHADFSASKWVKDAGARDAESAVRHLEQRFLRVPLSDANRAHVVQFIESQNLAPIGDPKKTDAKQPHLQEVNLRRALHLILCTPEFQLH